MKRMLIFLLCLCLIFTYLMSAFTVFAEESGEYDEFEEEYGEEYGDDPTDVENNYTESDTFYDLVFEVDTPREPEQMPPPEESATEDDDSEIYDSENYSTENAEQLQSEYILDEIIIKFKEPWQVPGKEKQLQQEKNKVQKVGFVEELDLYVVKVDDLNKTPNAVLNRIKNNKYIEYVEPNYTMSSDLVPNDPNYLSQSLVLTVLNAQNGWDILTGSSSAPIAVVDSGVSSHPDLPPLLYGYAAAEGFSPNNDKTGHGTGVAGTIGCIGNNGIGSAGINWNASIIPVKVDDGTGTMSVANVAKGIIWATDNGARIINLSLGTVSDSTTLRKAIDYAYEKGCAIFAATGNESKNSVCYPARYANVMAVGSTTNGKNRVASSNYGSGINLVAFGGFYTTAPSGNYISLSGTSFATPQVSALASMVWSINPELTNDQIYRLIEEGCKPLDGGFNEQTGYGIIDIAKTLTLAQKTVGGSTDVPSEETAPTPETLPPETPQETRNPPVIKLAGFTELTLEYGQAYNEMGYLAADCKNINLTSSVRVTNTVDIWKAGLYTITYEVTDSYGLSARATRIVTVNPKQGSQVPATAPKITINGSNPIVLHSTSSTQYKEQGAKAIDGDGTDISGLVKITGAINRTVAGTYTLTYSVVSPATGLSASVTRNVRIVAPTEKKDPRVKYGLSGQAKAGAKVIHTGIVANASGYIDLKITSIDKNMTVTVQLIDTASKKAVLTDTFSAVGTKQYIINKSKYELTVTVDKANGNSKYQVELLMPETEVLYFTDEEVPLASFTGSPKLTLIGSNPIILHLGVTPYIEQGARAVDYDDEDISGRVEIIGRPDTSTDGTYYVTYRVVNDLGLKTEIMREVRVLSPNQEFNFEGEEVPLSDSPVGDDIYSYVVVEGDNLWLVAQKQLGNGNRWREIYDLNKDIIGDDPNYICVGQVLRIRRN